MTKRFIADGMRVWDLENKIPSILTHNEEQQQKYLNELNRLHEELEQEKQKNRALKTVLGCTKMRLKKMVEYLE